MCDRLHLNYDFVYSSCPWEHNPIWNLNMKEVVKVLEEQMYGRAMWLAILDAIWKRYLDGLQPDGKPKQA